MTDCNKNNDGNIEPPKCEIEGETSDHWEYNETSKMPSFCSCEKGIYMFVFVCVCVCIL